VLATDVEWILVFTKRNSELNRKLIEEGGGSVECKALYWCVGCLEAMIGLQVADLCVHSWGASVQGQRG
jgi:hypothetical protein